MKFKITEGVNQYDGKSIFYVYEWRDEKWHYKWGAPDELACRAFITRIMNPAAEKVIAEIEG